MIEVGASGIEGPATRRPEGYRGNSRILHARVNRQGVDGFRPCVVREHREAVQEAFCETRFSTLNWPPLYKEFTSMVCCVMPSVAREDTPRIGGERAAWNVHGWIQLHQFPMCDPWVPT